MTYFIFNRNTINSIILYTNIHYTQTKLNEIKVLDSYEFLMETSPQFFRYYGLVIKILVFNLFLTYTFLNPFKN